MRLGDRAGQTNSEEVGPVELSTLAEVTELQIQAQAAEAQIVVAVGLVLDRDQVEELVGLLTLS